MFKKAFTVVELLITLVIVGIIISAGVAVVKPYDMYMSYLQKQAENTLQEGFANGIRNSAARRFPEGSGGAKAVCEALAGYINHSGENCNQASPKFNLANADNPGDLAQYPSITAMTGMQFYLVSDAGSPVFKRVEVTHDGVTTITCEKTYILYSDIDGQKGNTFIANGSDANKVPPHYFLTESLLVQPFDSDFLRVKSPSGETGAFLTEETCNALRLNPIIKNDQDPGTCSCGVNFVCENNECTCKRTCGAGQVLDRTTCLCTTVGGGDGSGDNDGDEGCGYEGWLEKDSVTGSCVCIEYTENSNEDAPEECVHYCGGFSIDTKTGNCTTECDTTCPSGPNYYLDTDTCSCVKKCDEINSCTPAPSGNCNVFFDYTSCSCQEICNFGEVDSSS